MGIKLLWSKQIQFFLKMSMFLIYENCIDYVCKSNVGITNIFLISFAYKLRVLGGILTL